jgi:hypothetical protein
VEIANDLPFADRFALRHTDYPLRRDVFSEIQSIVEKLPRLTESDLENLGHRGMLRLTHAHARNDYVPT